MDLTRHLPSAEGKWTFNLSPESIFKINDIGRSLTRFLRTGDGKPSEYTGEMHEHATRLRRKGRGEYVTLNIIGLVRAVCVELGFTGNINYDRLTTMLERRRLFKVHSAPNMAVYLVNKKKLKAAIRQLVNKARYKVHDQKKALKTAVDDDNLDDDMYPLLKDIDPKSFVRPPISDKNRDTEK